MTQYSINQKVTPNIPEGGYLNIPGIVSEIKYIRELEEVIYRVMFSDGNHAFYYADEIDETCLNS